MHNLTNPVPAGTCAHICAHRVLWAAYTTLRIFYQLNDQFLAVQGNVHVVGTLQRFATNYNQMGRL